MNCAVIEASSKMIIKQFKSDKIANSNIIIDLLKDLKGEDCKRIKKSISALSQIFCILLKDEDLRPLSILPEQVQSAKVQYENWLLDRYGEVHDHLVSLLNHSDLQVQQLSLVAIAKLMQSEMNHPLTNEKIVKMSFPTKKLLSLLSVMLSHSHDNRVLIKRLKEYLEYPDFQCFLLTVLHRLMVAKKKVQDNDVYIRNVFAILEMISLPIEGTKPLDSPRLFGMCEQGETEEMEEITSKFVFPYADMKVHFNGIWEIFLNCNIPPDIYKRCLIIIPDRVIMHLDRPVKLTDFFMNAYNTGGAHSVMALQGVFVLVNQYNLEYPDFYDKVYALFEPTIFQAKYKPRFFMLCDKFFSSTLLPEYIVAAFIKRMSRLTLIAPSNCLILLLKFIVNLLLLYPSLHRMINNPNAIDLKDDPFMPDEPNPKFCKAGESSLWEVATLRHHSLCGISKAANFITRNLPDVKNDLSKFINNTYEELFEKASKIQEPQVFTNINEPEALFKYSEDDMGLTWSIL